MKNHRRQIYKKSKIGILFWFFAMAWGCSSDAEVEKPSAKKVLIAKAEKPTVRTADPIIKTKKPMPRPYYTSMSESYARKRFFIIAGEYLWTLNKEEIIISDGGKPREIVYEDYKVDPCILAGKKISKTDSQKINISFVGEGGKSDCIPRPRFFWKNHLHFDARGLAGPKNFGVFGDKVIITLGGEQYYFTFGGTFLKKAKEDKWWEITMPPYAKYPWTVDKIHKQVSRKKHKYNSIVGKIFSGPWVVLVKKSPKIKWGTVELSLVDRKTGKTKDVYKNVTRTNKGYFREYGDGFYIDKVDPATVTGPYTGIKRPYLWYGKKKINLESSDDTFCYVFHEEKKCIPDPGRKLFEVVETDTMRLFIDKDRMWVERFSKKGDVKEDGN